MTATYTTLDGRTGLWAASNETHTCLRFADGTAEWFPTAHLTGTGRPPSRRRTHPLALLGFGLAGMVVVVLGATHCSGPEPYVDPHAERWGEVYRGVQQICREQGLSISECGDLERRARRMVRDGAL